MFNVGNEVIAKNPNLPFRMTVVYVFQTAARVRCNFTGSGNYAGIFNFNEVKRLECSS